MKLPKPDWRVLRNPLLVTAVVALSSAALVALTYRGLTQTRERVEKHELALREAHHRYQESGEERDNILRYRDQFVDLQRHGFVGEEQRINWVDALRAASLGLRMFGVNYQIEAQQAYNPFVTVASGPYRLRQSVMKINMGLLHEQDLIRFFDALTAQQAGVFILRECNLQRQGTPQAGNFQVQPNLQADCSLAWLTMAEPLPGDKP